MDGDKKKEGKVPNPRATTNPFSAITFSWLNGFFWKGYHRDLEMSDLYAPLKEHTSSLIGSKFEMLWEDEKKRSRPSLLRVIIRCYGWEIALYGIVLFVLECVIRIAQPLFIGLLVRYFDERNIGMSKLNSLNIGDTSPCNNTSKLNMTFYGIWNCSQTTEALSSNTTLLQPIFLGRLIMFYTPKQTNITQEEAYMYASLVVLSSAITVFIVHPYMMGILHLGMKLRVACCSLIYRKSLKLSRTALGETTVGQVVNLLSNDVNRFDVAMIFLHNLWIGPLQTVVTTYLMWREIGESAVVGVIFMLLFVPLQAWLGKRTSVLRLKTALRTDERVRLMNEIISGIQVIKMYSWEGSFAQLVHLARKREIKEIRATSYIRGLLISFIMFVTRVSLFLSILSYVVLGNSITAEKVFIVTSYYNLLRQTMTVFFPQGVAQIAEANISIRRLQKFMMYEETTKPLPSADYYGDGKKAKQDSEKSSSSVVNNPLYNLDQESDEAPVNGKIKKLDEEEEMEAKDDVTLKVRRQQDKLAIGLNSVTAKWVEGQSDNTLSNITMKVKPGSLVAVIGPVGAGKSSLLNVILEELPISEGSLQVNGTIAYASQEPWLFVGSIRQNILFGAEMERVRYNMVIRKCALERDFALLPRGDKTVVGERGISLSGGQRARINLARAVYRKADIFLLDDPLSAVDTHVGRQLFDNCIVSYLRSSTRILITHQLQYLNEVDHIIILKNGEIAAEGSFEALQASGLDFAELLKKDSEEEEPPELLADSIDEKGRKDLHRHMSIQSTNSTEDGFPVEDVEEEQRSKGSVGKKVYGAYLKATGPWYLITSMFSLAILAQLLASGSDYWTSYWVNMEELAVTGRSENSANNHDFSSMSEELVVLWNGMALTRGHFIYIYSVIIVMLIIMTMSRSFMFFYLAMRASTSLHNSMFQSVTRACMRFFHTNPSGRILNRFSKDMGSIDEMLPSAAIDVLQIGLTLIGIVLVVTIVNYWLMIPTLGVAFIFYLLRIYYLSTSRSVKRLEGVTRSPVFSHLSASLQGMTTIRAFGAQKELEREFDSHQDLHSSAWYLFIASSRAFGFWLDLVCIIYLAFVTLSFLVMGKESMGGNVGLAITQAMGLTGMFQWGMRQSTELENQMTSVERVTEYNDIEKEGALESSVKVREGWPEEGGLVMEGVWLRYAPGAPEEEAALRGLFFSLSPRDKLGIVGRTGAGKSSIIAALFRLAYIEGKIEIDGVDTSTLGLHDLRGKISIIPQEPVLFSGTMRKNLDPFNQYSDDVLWRALEEVEMKDVVIELEGGLNSKMSEGGTNLSVGQRQLVCLARAIVKKNRILVMDEATANVDPQTDALIQTTIRKKFAECTVLTIAHRLHTVMDSDKVLVMDAGRAVEMDHPHILLQNQDGVLRGMVNQTGKAMCETLIKIAQQCYEKKIKKE